MLQEDCRQRTWKTLRDLYSLLPSRETGREFVSLNTTITTWRDQSLRNVKSIFHNQNVNKSFPKLYDESSRPKRRCLHCEPHAAKITIYWSFNRKQNDAVNRSILIVAVLRRKLGKIKRTKQKTTPQAMLNIFLPL